MKAIKAIIRAPTIHAKIYRAALNGLPAETYDGEYTVTPKTAAQELATENKVMKENITVLEIPYCEVSNDSGTTVVIGG